MGTTYSDAREEEERANAARETMAMEYEDFRGKFRRTMSNEREEMTRKVAESEAQLQQQADYLEKMYMDQLEEEKGEMEKKMDALQNEFRHECKRMAEERAELMVQTNLARTECERLAAEKMQMFHNMTEFRDLCERTMEEGRMEMARKQDAMAQELARNREEMAKKLSDEKAAAERASAEMARKMEEEKAAAARASAEMARKMQEEKASAEHRLAGFREQTEAQLRKMEEEKAAAAAATMAMERTMAKEKAEGERRLAAFRKETEEQLQIERQVTTDIMQCLRELPPLQTAMEFGDIRMLEEELQKWSAGALPERFGDCKGVVEAVLKLARERLLIWRAVQNTVQEVLKESERTGGNVSSLTDRCLRLFRAIKEAQLTKLDISRSDPSIMQKICAVFYTWQEAAMSFPNSVQRSIVTKVVTWKALGAFQFVDLDICLRLVDRNEDGNNIFLSRARTIVEDEKTEPKNLKPLLAHIETMLFFLKYAKSEDLHLTHAEFRKQMTSNSQSPSVAQHLKWALSAYPPGSELARLSEGRSLMDGKDVSKVLEEIRAPIAGARKDDLGFFREIFYHWALAMRSKFDLLVLPHHTQVVCLLVFRHFLQQAQRDPASNTHTLVAQVGTGEGKSMIIAILAIFVVMMLKKKVHIVVDDESLLERDFWTFKPLFDAFELPATNGVAKRPITAKLCVTEERVASEKNPCLVPRVDPEADVCYCEGKHVQSFYASIARDDTCDFDTYNDRILIVDEVDALVIDEEPNEAFVYPNQELSKMATMIAGAMKKGTRPEEAIKDIDHPAAGRLLREMSLEWAVGTNMVAGEDFVYVKEAGKNALLRAGRANLNEWSLALDCRNFQDGHSREILFQERMFVMSRPRVFRKYFRLLGVTGSIGSDAERKFLQETYRASFFEVPPFLKTCRGSPFHAAMPAQLGAKKQAVYVESSPEAQLSRLAEVALEARERVPVLIIAKDRSTAEHFVERLRLLARSQGLGKASEDAVRSLSRTLYEADPDRWKENLNRATLPLGDGHGQSGGGHTWRITVTDPRGGRGTDYRVDDSDVDGRGGLLLIPTIVPESQRDWVQFLGRTARQDRKGQWCAVLCSADYEALSQKYRRVLTGGNDLLAIDTILSWGDKECTERIQGSAALHNCGVRVNELCEEIFGRRAKLLEDFSVREAVVSVCQSYRYMSVRDIDNAFAQIPGFVPADVPTEAIDLGPAATQQRVPYGSARMVSSDRRSIGRPNQAGYSMTMPAVPGSMGALGPTPKMVVFCLDYSTSMLSRDTGTGLNRFETCIQCVQNILRDQVKDCDMVGIVGFGADVRTVVFPTVKGNGLSKISAELSRLTPSMQGGTCFFDAVSACVQSMGLSAVAPLQWPRWLVCLTDGDDVGSKRGNMRGEEVTKVLDSGTIQNLNMVVITVGRFKDENVRVIDTWVGKVESSGGMARHVSEKDAAKIEMAFEVVAEFLAADVGGAQEL
mmetsp:Transcript_16583/g.30742  ORF Transcript_16583/g.30742 Transcript_16583/m.30742 type:complete len:1467 (+) Transcript_16583:61-4461(+)